MKKTNKVQTNTIVTSIKRIKAKEVAAWFKDIMSQTNGLRHLLSDKKTWGAFSIYSHLRRSDGKPKLAFPSRSKAQKSADSMRRKYNATFSVYKCMFCDGWHISKTGVLPQENHKSPVSEQYDKALVSQPAQLDSEKIMSTNIPDLAPVYGGFRGRTLSSQNQRYAWNTLIEAGLHQVIDLRADYKSDHYQKLCQHSGVDYFYYPVATKPTDIELMAAKFPEFCRLIDKGGFYIACAMGLHRTDIALCTYWMFYAADKGVEPPQIRGYRQEEGHDTSKIMRILNAFYNYLTERDGKEPMPMFLFKERKNIINELSKK